jgi:DNA-binding MurR/RpiR family transcriptional regulator
MKDNNAARAVFRDLVYRARHTFVADKPMRQKRVPILANSANVIEELRLRYVELSDSQKHIADHIFEHSQTAAFSTLDQMAMRLRVNPSTIVRFCYRLGLKGFPDLQGRMRQVVRDQLARIGEQAAADGGDHLRGTIFGDSLVHDVRNLQRTIMNLTVADLNRAVDRIVAAQGVCAIGGFSAFALAHYFALALGRLRPRVCTLTADDGASMVRLAGIADMDCLLAFAFAPYAAFTQRAALRARERNATIITVSDSPISPVGQVADVVLVASSGRTGLHHSLAAPTAVANALLNGVRAAKGVAALDRYNSSDHLLDE